MQRYTRFLVFAGVVVAAVGAVYITEFTIGRVELDRPGYFPAEMFSRDVQRGIALTPGFDRRVKRVRAFRVTVNAQGYRDMDWHAKPPPRVLLAGSSATFGFGLEQKDGIAARLQRALPDQASVLNAGVYSYGPSQILATIERECPRWKPQVVLYLHEYKLTRRDFQSTRTTTPSIQEPTDEPTPNFSWSLRATRAYLSNRGLHPRQIAERLWGLDRLSQSYLMDRYAVTRPSAEFCTDCIALAGDAISEMRLAAEACGARFLMAVLPGPAEAYYGLREPATEAVLSAIVDNSPDFPMIDLRPEVTGGSRMNIPGLDYFNEEAAEWIAQRLAQPVRNALSRPPLPNSANR